MKESWLKMYGLQKRCMNRVKLDITLIKVCYRDIPWWMLFSRQYGERSMQLKHMIWWRHQQCWRHHWNFIRLLWWKFSHFTDHWWRGCVYFHSTFCPAKSSPSSWSKSSLPSWKHMQLSSTQIFVSTQPYPARNRPCNTCAQFRHSI